MDKTITEAYAKAEEARKALYAFPRPEGHNWPELSKAHEKALSEFCDAVEASKDYEIFSAYASEQVRGSW